MNRIDWQKLTLSQRDRDLIKSIRWSDADLARIKLALRQASAEGAPA